MNFKKTVRRFLNNKKPKVAKRFLFLYPETKDAIGVCSLCGEEIYNKKYNSVDIPKQEMEKIDHCKSCGCKFNLTEINNK